MKVKRKRIAQWRDMLNGKRRNPQAIIEEEPLEDELPSPPSNYFII
jgi:hypothetical protein